MSDSQPDRQDFERLWSEIEGRATGYLHWELPHTLDGVLGSVVERFSDGDEETRRAILDTMTPEGARALAAYGERMASLAVHQDSSATLLRGLVAVGMAAAKEYEKELLVLLPLFDASARKLTIDPDALFRSAAEVLGEHAPGWLASFPERPEPERALSVMGYEERRLDNGLLYARTTRELSRDQVEELERWAEG